VAPTTNEDQRPVILPRQEHSLSRSLISTNALKVLYRLHRSGYLAYLVGGGVRDILLGREPKDFDVGTNARPREVRRLFGNSRIIGRRFRLVHVLFKGEVVEVSTFRASPDAPDSPDEWENGEVEASSEDGTLLEPSTTEEIPEYGTPREDAFRRDFTVNALFYNIADFSVLDYVEGLGDLEAQVIRTIGPAQQRFEEDPVRMMRALEYATRLGFDLDPATAEAIRSCAHLIREAAPARLTYELLETLGSGHAAAICHAWARFGVFEHAFPELTTARDRLPDVLSELDQQHRQGRRFHESSLLGMLFLPQYSELLDKLLREPRLDNSRLLAQQRALLQPACARMHVSNHTQHLIHHGLFATTKLRRGPERGRQVLKLARQECFNVMWDLYSIGAAAGLLPNGCYDAWSNAFAKMRHPAQSTGKDSRSRRPTRSHRRRNRRK